jgi:hypothetical protein
MFWQVMNFLDDQFITMQITGLDHPYDDHRVMFWKANATKTDAGIAVVLDHCRADQRFPYFKLPNLVMDPTRTLQQNILMCMRHIYSDADTSLIRDIIGVGKEDQIAQHLRHIPGSLGGVASGGVGDGCWRWWSMRSLCR